MSHSIRVGLIAVVLVTIAGGISLAEDGNRSDAIFIAQTIPFAENSGVTPAVQRECRLETQLQEFIKSYAKGMKIEITTKPLEEIEESGGKVLVLEIVNVVGMGGGAYSGPKSVRATGELRQNGKVIGSFVSARFSTGGAWAGFKGTCSILGRCIKVMGQDIAAWLKNPTMDAGLGDA